MIKKLEYWLNEEGSILLLRTMEQLDDCAADKIKGFVELYRFLLAHSSDSVEKMADHLFYIPGQFFREFMAGKRALIGSVNESQDPAPVYEGNRYIVTKLGIFNEVPFLISGGLYK